MRIGLLTPTLSLEHGTGNYSLELIRNLSETGLQLDVVSPKDTASIDWLHVHRILPIGDDTNFSKLCGVLPQVAWLFRKCDIIHSAVERYAVLAAGIARKRPLILTAHGSFVNISEAWRWPLSVFYEWAFRKSTRVICLGKFTEHRSITVMPGIQTKIVEPGISVERFDRFARRRNDNYPLVLCVAAIKRRKGIVQLLRAIAVVREKLPDIRCVIIGTQRYGPDYLTEVRSEINGLRLHDYVRLLGHVSETTLLQWYADADVFVLPAINDGWRFEGYGLAYLEAGAARLPVIGTRNCGAEDSVIHNETGLLLPQETLETDLPKAILRLLLDPEERARMGVAGRKKAESQSWERFRNHMVTIYENVLTKRK